MRFERKENQVNTSRLECNRKNKKELMNKYYTNSRELWDDKNNDNNNSGNNGDDDNS